MDALHFIANRDQLLREIAEAKATLLSKQEMLHSDLYKHWQGMSLDEKKKVYFAYFDELPAEWAALAKDIADRGFFQTMSPDLINHPDTAFQAIMWAVAYSLKHPRTDGDFWIDLANKTNHKNPKWPKIEDTKYVYEVE